jgi:hypothetical protein
MKLKKKIGAITGDQMIDADPKEIARQEAIKKLKREGNENGHEHR